MSNREKISWCAGILLLVMLYLLSSTDLIIKEKKREICRISVIIDNVNDNYYGSFRAGMDMAEKKYQADVNFITLYAENDEEQQEELIVREIKDGANAIILAPVREDLAVMKLDEISPGCPVIFLGPTAINSSVACSICGPLRDGTDAWGEDCGERGSGCAGMPVLRGNGVHGEP